MTKEKLRQIIHQAIENISTQIPAYKSSERDWGISRGHVALCIIDDDGNIYGKIWGDDKVKGRSYFDIAYRKASQVWITGYNTGEYEKLVFAGKLDHHDFGITLPDLIGWDGGQLIQLDEETRICCGFSGFHGSTDLAIVKKGVDEAMGLIK
jgi:glc operon protein GlcG